MSNPEDVLLPVFIKDEPVGTICLAENDSYTIVMEPGTVERLRSDILSRKLLLFGTIPVMTDVRDAKAVEEKSVLMAPMVDDQNVKDARIEAVRAVAQVGTVHPQSFTRVADEIESYILNGYTEPDTQRTEAKFVERLRFRGFGEVEISDVMIALRDGDLSVYKTRK